MQRTRGLMSMLEDMARVFYGKPIPVRFTSENSHVDSDGGFIAVTTNLTNAYGINVSGAQELRLLIDITSHEVEHLRETKLDGKREFVEEYEERMVHPAYIRLAGTVVNVLEDVYVDASRLRRYPGLRSAHAFFVNSQVQKADHTGASLPFERKLVSGFWQVCHAGTAVGIDRADTEIREALAKCRLIANEVRETTDPDERLALAHQAMAVLLELLPDEPDANQVDSIRTALHKTPTDAHPGEEPSGDPPTLDDFTANPRPLETLLVGHEPSEVAIVNEEEVY